MGILAIPSSLGITDDAFRTNEYPKRVFYNADPLAPNEGINQITPHTTGTLPRQAAEIAEQYQTKLSGQSALYQGQHQGRIDSQVGMGFVLETNNVGIEAPGNEIADCWTTVYSALLREAPRLLVDMVDLQRVMSLESDLVGVVVDEGGALDLSSNPLPSPEEVKINIKSRTPPSPTQRKQDLMQSLQLGIIDQQEFRLTVYREGLEIPVGNVQEYQTWRKARINIRTLFNDGQTPGTDRVVALDPEADNQNVLRKEVQSFMASPEFAMAAKPVKEAFLAYKTSIDGMSARIRINCPTLKMRAIRWQQWVCRPA
jgi:hypothetical protein